MCQLRRANQFLEKRTVVNHCLAEIFCAGLPPLFDGALFCVPYGNSQEPTDCPRRYLPPLFKVTYWITTCGHQHRLVAGRPQ
jgi:hypothetical protein